MKFKTHTGREVNINVNKWIIDWDAPCRSKFQFRINQFFRPFFQYSVCLSEFKVPGKRLFVDLLNVSQKIAVESMGEQHRSCVLGYFHKTRLDFGKSIKRDFEKLEFLNRNNIKLIEVYPEDEKNLSPKWIKDNFDIDLV